MAAANTLDNLRNNIGVTYQRIADIHTPLAADAALQRQLLDLCHHLANLCVEVAECRRAVNQNRETPPISP